MKVLLAVIVAATLAGCAALPGSGPTAATISASADPGDPLRNYELVDLDAAKVAVIASYGPKRLSTRFTDRRPSPQQTIGIGDMVQVTIFEAGSGGLFTAASGQLGGGTKNVSLPTQAVEADGTIGIPYAGRVRAAGRTPSQVTQDIVRGLEGKAIDPQAIVSVQQARSHLATVSGQVGSPSRVTLSPMGDRLLDVLSNAGGPAGTPTELFVQVTRGSTTAVSPLRAIVENPSENIFIWPNDTIFVFREPQVFTAFGATGSSGNFPFEYERMTIAEAVGAARGLDDTRADPAGVFIYRLERREIVCAILGYDPCVDRNGLEPVIYRLNLRDPNGLFLAKQMFVRNKDVLYVANAEAAELLKFLRLIGTTVGTANSAIGVAN